MISPSQRLMWQGSVGKCYMMHIFTWKMEKIEILKLILDKEKKTYTHI